MQGRSCCIYYILFFKDETSLYEEIDVAEDEQESNTHKTSEIHTNLGYSELDEMKTEAGDDRDYQGVLKQQSEYVIPAPMKSQEQIPGKKEAYEELETSTQNPGYTELNESRHRIAADEGAYQKLRKEDSDYVIPAHERREAYEDIKMGRNLPGYKQLDQSKRETEESTNSSYQKLVKT